MRRSSLPRVAPVSLSPKSSTMSSNGISNPLDRRIAGLDTALNRLRRSVIMADGEREKRIRTCEYEQARLDSNIEFARSLLTGLERDVMDVRSHARRTEMQASLSRKREALEAVVDRMNDLKEIGIKENEELSEVEEDILGPILEDLEKKGYKFPSETQTSTYTDGTQVESISEEGRSQDGTDLSAKEEDEPTQQATEPSHPPTKTTQTIRPRNHASSVPQKPTQPDQALSTTTTSSDAARAVLFRKSKARATTQATTATAEALQDRQRREQESIVEDILRVASGLRANAHRFADHLEKDKLSVQKAGDAMDTAETGMETAGRKMIGLKRITEGEGWWGRMILYAWIFGLMVLLVVVVFVLPKFRL